MGRSATACQTPPLPGNSRSPNQSQPVLCSDIANLNPSIVNLVRIVFTIGATARSSSAPAHPMPDGMIRIQSPKQPITRSPGPTQPPPRLRFTPSLQSSGCLAMPSLVDNFKTQSQPDKRSNMPVLTFLCLPALTVPTGRMGAFATSPMPAANLLPTIIYKQHSFKAAIFLILMLPDLLEESEPHRFDCVCTPLRIL